MSWLKHPRVSEHARRDFLSWAAGCCWYRAISKALHTPLTIWLLLKENLIFTTNYCEMFAWKFMLQRSNADLDGRAKAPFLLLISHLYSFIFRSFCHLHNLFPRSPFFSGAESISYPPPAPTVICQRASRIEKWACEQQITGSNFQTIWEKICVGKWMNNIPLLLHLYLIKMLIQVIFDVCVDAKFSPQTDLWPVTLCKQLTRTPKQPRNPGLAMYNLY